MEFNIGDVVVAVTNNHAIAKVQDGEMLSGLTYYKTCDEK